jgi:DNA-binding NtrC family response regulator
MDIKGINKMEITDINILIVDDDDSIRTLLSEGLSELGYSCTEAGNGEDALEKFVKNRFEIVLLDIKLPGMSGMDVLRDLHLDLDGTGVIMITGSNDVDTAVEAVKSGASDFIVKPFVIGRVDEAIRGTLQDLSTQRCNDYMEAIASGVEQRFDIVNRHSDLVMNNTVETARLIGIPEEAINNWLNNQMNYNMVKKKPLDIAMGKLKRSPHG